MAEQLELAISQAKRNPNLHPLAATEMDRHPSVKDVPPPFDPALLGFTRVDSFRHNITWNGRSEGYPIILNWRTDLPEHHPYHGGGIFWVYHEKLGLNYNGHIPNIEFLKAIIDVWQL